MRTRLVVALATSALSWPAVAQQGGWGTPPPPQQPTTGTGQQQGGWGTPPPPQQPTTGTGQQQGGWGTPPPPQQPTTGTGQQQGGWGSAGTGTDPQQGGWGTAGAGTGAGQQQGGWGTPGAGAGQPGGWGSGSQVQPASPGQAPPSVVGGRTSGGAPYPQPQQAPGAGWVLVQPLPGATSASSCTVKVGEDRAMVQLVDATGAIRRQVALGEDRVQQVLVAPDGSWALAFAKVRRAAQHYAIALDLQRCEDQRPVGVSGVPERAEFGATEATLTYADGRVLVKRKNRIVE